MSFPRRYPKQPWIFDVVDLLPQGDPETVIFLPSKESILGLHIRGVDHHLMLGIREDELGRPLSCAITNEVEIDIWPAQSNPRRHTEEDGA